jgi:hypothetical protein
VLSEPPGCTTGTCGGTTEPLRSTSLNAACSSLQSSPENCGTSSASSPPPQLLTTCRPSVSTRSLNSSSTSSQATNRTTGMS